MSLANRNIQVSGLTDFPEARWREAILYYLFGIWSNNDKVAYRPKIMFNDLTLRLNRGAGTYYAYGRLEVPEKPPRTNGDEMLKVDDPNQCDVEIGLIRFVKNSQIKMLVLNLQPGSLVLWKKTRRGEYGCAGFDLPYAYSSVGPIWTKEEYERAF